MFYYTGVGARATPPEVLKEATDIAVWLRQVGYCLRSGGAQGMDQAFESGAAEMKEVFLAKHSTPQAEEIASQFHPAWDRCKPFVKRLHGRNAFQVLGRHLNFPSSFLICWTPDGCLRHEERTIKTGGTGTAISIADAFGVEVFNLSRNRDDLYSHLNTIYHQLRGGV